VTISVLIADDQALVRAGFRMVLDAEDDIVVVGEAANGEQAVHSAHRLRPDVVLMDIRMPELDGIAATARIAAARDGEHARVLILTTFDLDEYVYDALGAGASGFLLKDSPPEQLVNDPRRRRRRGAAGAERHEPADRAVRALAGAGACAATRLRRADRAREVEVFALLARGLSNAEIATELVVGDTTVKTHVGRLLAKLGLRDRVQAVVVAYESGIVRPGRAG